MSEPKYIDFNLIGELVVHGDVHYEDLKRIPAADVIEVVRCKDCKHYKTMFCKMDIWHKDITLYRADENDYCSYGVRKDG